MTIKRSIQTVVLGLAAFVMLGVANESNAQSFTTVRFLRIGTQQYVAVPTYWQIRPTYFNTSGRNTASASRKNYWKVGLGTRNGVRTRTYYVNDSREAMRRARRDFPQSRLIGVVRVSG